jgi:hypothetical protein
MGGMSSRLPETRTSLLRAACTQDETRRRLAVDNLTRAYWKPIYCYLRRHRYQNEEAKDLTQEFFHDFVLEGKLLQSADKEVGHFRQLLTTALKRFLFNVERDKNRQKRAPQGGITSLSGAEGEEIDPPGSEATPEQAFWYAWITDLLDYALAQTRQECGAGGREVHWQVFHRKILAPILEDAEDMPIKQICRMYGVDGESRADNMIVTVKRCFRRVLTQRLHDLARSEAQAQEEFQEILRFLSENGARL